jgi:hypothetical protein
MKYTRSVLQNQLLGAIRKSIRMGYSDGAGLYARMLTRFILSNDFAQDETDMQWALSLTGRKREMMLALLRALRASGKHSYEALPIVRACLND